MNGTKATVVADYQAAYSDPLTVLAGDTLHIEREDDEYPGWLWCVAADGLAGWVPEPFLVRDGRVARLRRDYDAGELTVYAGEQLNLLEEVNGWWWAVTDAGTMGWVPAAHVRLEAG
jgi:hypothetical protein